MATDYIADKVAPTSGAQFTIGGILSKTAETALDIAANKLGGGTKSVGSAYPTGQVNPDRVASDNEPVPVVSSSAAAVQKAAAFMPWVIGGGIVLAIVFAGLALRRR